MAAIPDPRRRRSAVVFALVSAPALAAGCSGVLPSSARAAAAETADEGSGPAVGAATGAALPGNAVFTFLKRVTAAELNAVLDEERTAFLASHESPAGYATPPKSTAANAIELYTATYESTIPERGSRKITASGLVAIPVLAQRGRLPSIIYQHGTAYGKYEVPSYAFQPTNPTGHPHYDGAYETRYMAALYGGNGYAVIAADYFGMGASAAEPEAYFVKESTQQASYDFYQAANAFLRSKGIETSRLFVGGWSQGGLNATGLLEKLAAEKIKVAAAFTASNPADPFAALNGLMYFPRAEIDAVWLNTIVALSAFAFESYYDEPGLARSVIAADAYDDLRSIYERTYAGPPALGALLQRYAERPLIDYFRPEYRDPAFFAQSKYGRLLQQSETLRQFFQTPLRTYYGTHDEAIKEIMGTLVAAYQHALIGNPGDLSQSRVEAVKVVGGDHRRTFVSAASLAKDWFAEFREAP